MGGDISKIPTATISQKTTPVTIYVKNRVIYLSGTDSGATVNVYDLMGILRSTSKEDHLSVKNPGVYLIETKSGGKRITEKISVL